MESIDTSSQRVANPAETAAVYRPKYLLIEANIPGVGLEYVPIRNYNTRLLPPKGKKEKKGEESEEDEAEVEAAHLRNSNIYLNKTNKYNFDRIKRKDLLFHTDHGYLKVVQVDHESDDDAKPAISFQTKVLDAKGKKSEQTVTFTIDEAKACAKLVTRFKIDMKIFLPSNEAVTTKLDVPVRNKLKVNDVIKRIEDLTNASYLVFIDGQIVDRKSKIQAALKKDSKVLLYNQVSTVSRPDGIRAWYRFPKYVIDNESVTRSDDQSIVYVPIQDNIEIHGFMMFRHTNEGIDYMEVRMKIRIHDESDNESNILFEKTFDTIEVRFNDVQWD